MGKTEGTIVFKPTDLEGALSVIGLVFVTAAGVFLSLRFDHLGWLAGQLVLGCVLWSWFSLLHSAGHNALFRSARLNDWAGSLASIFCFVPFFSWRYHHAAHHVWVGWSDLDPTTDEVPAAAPPAGVLAFLDFCWRWWIPVLSLGHVLSNFWNPARMGQVARTRLRQRQCVGSMALVLGAWVALALAAGPLALLKIAALPFAAFLVLSDPVLMSQHAMLPARASGGRNVAPFDVRDHDRFTRTFTTHPLIDRWVFLNFNLHGVHHRFPNVPHYHLHRLAFFPTHSTSLTRWIRETKRLSVRDLLWGAQ